MNRSAKEIAYILGLSNSAIGNTLTRATQKLGLSSRTELAALFSPKGMRARMAELEVAGEQIAVGSYPIADEQRFASLTDAERAVAIHLMQGATNRFTENYACARAWKWLRHWGRREPDLYQRRPMPK
jgi:Bacterial regulatory proteins, luxR family